MSDVFAWTALGTFTALILALIGLLATALFRALDRIDGVGGRIDGVGGRIDGLGGRIDGLGDRIDGLGDRVDGLTGRVDRLAAQQREDKVEILERLDVLAERVTRLERAA